MSNFVRCKIKTGFKYYDIFTLFLIDNTMKFEQSLFSNKDWNK